MSSAGEFPISRVILYKNGMGYFERKGVVKNNTTVDLVFPTKEMDDILKSVTISPVLPSNDHPTATITYDIPPPNNIGRKGAIFGSSVSTSSSPSLAVHNSHSQVLRSLCGEVVTVVCGKNTFEGVLLAVEENTVKENKCDSISLLIEGNSIKIIKMEEVTNLKMSHNISDTKSLKIHVNTNTQQQVIISYIRACPIWKATYRAVLSANAQLYGWATVNNTDADNWQGVSLSLVTGQPVSFIQQLYVPKFGKRPRFSHAKSELSSLGISSLLQQHLQDGAEESDSDDDRRRDRSRESVRDRYPRLPNSNLRRQTSRSRSRSRSRSPPTSFPKKRPLSPLGAGQQSSVSTVSSETVDLFRYDLKIPIDLQSNRSALVPIVDSAFPGKQIALYNEQLHTEHPFSTLQLVNNTGLTLESGPITVFENGMYIGEAFLQTTKPNERRFVPFAIEFGLVVSKKPAQHQTLKPHWASIVNGKLTFTAKTTETHHYIIHNKSQKVIELILEHPKSKSESQENIVIEKVFVEKSDHVIDVKTEYVTGLLYGLNFNVPAKSMTHLTVSSQRTTTTIHQLSTLGVAMFANMQRTDWVDSKLRTVLQGYDAAIRKKAHFESQIEELQINRTSIASEQKRLRENLVAIKDKDLKSGSRFLTKLEQAEDELDKLNAQYEVLNKSLKEAHSELNAVCAQLQYDDNVTSKMEQ